MCFWRRVVTLPSLSIILPVWHLKHQLSSRNHPSVSFFSQLNNFSVFSAVSIYQPLTAPGCCLPGHLWMWNTKTHGRGWQIENWFFTSGVRGLYPNRLAEYTNIPMLSSVVLLSATMRIRLTPLHSMSQTHGTDGLREGKRRESGKETGRERVREGKRGEGEWFAVLTHAHYSVT